MFCVEYHFRGATGDTEPINIVNPGVALFEYTKRKTIRATMESVRWLIGWLVGWLVSWLVSWLVGRLVGW